MYGNPAWAHAYVVQKCIYREKDTHIYIYLISYNTIKHHTYTYTDKAIWTWARFGRRGGWRIFVYPSILPSNSLSIQVSCYLCSYLSNYLPSHIQDTGPKRPPIIERLSRWGHMEDDRNWNASLQSTIIMCLVPRCTVVLGWSENDSVRLIMETRLTSKRASWWWLPS